LSEQAQAIIHSYTNEVEDDPINDLNLDDPIAVGDFLHKGLWMIANN
jgi:hypothetical protein